MNAQPSHTPWHPRILMVPAATAREGAALATAAAHARDLGFDHLLLAGPAEPARIEAACRSAADHGIRLLVDLLPEPDPAREARAGRDPRRQALIPENDQDEATLAKLVDVAMAAGVAGFRAPLPQAVTPEIWARLRARAADCRLLLWSHGLTEERIDALAACGFDAAVASDAWWDLAAPWMLDEIARLSRIGSVLACPEVPFGPRLPEILGGPEAAEAAGRRSLKLAPFLFDGIVVQAGFDRGAPDPLRPDMPAPEGPRQPAYDLSQPLRVANAGFERLETTGRPALRMLTGESGPVLAFRAEETRLVVASRLLDRRLRIDPQPLLARGPDMAARRLVDHPPGTPLDLAPGGVAVLEIAAAPPVRGPEAGPAEAAARLPRIAIEAVQPLLDDGRFAIRRRLGSTLEVEADIFADGHDVIKAVLRLRAEDEAEWREVPMTPVVNDRWRGRVPLDRLGRHRFEIMAWRDAWGSYRADLAKKQAAGVVRPVDLADGLALLRAHGIDDIVQEVEQACDDAAKVRRLLDDETRAAMALVDPRPFASATPRDYPVDVERLRAGFAAWYELFPRSETDDPGRHGRFEDVIRRLPEIRAMGFDVLYMPPIHPIGRTNRKGRNNALTAGPEDPGSPYAIGSEAGGHDAIHPELGTLEDFRALVAAAADQGMEVALDFAIQCSPDHPWLKDHPDWFAWRSDGSMRYAENPPKRYEDIVNVDFYGQGAVPDLWQALRDVVAFWVAEGVRLFRVDNPHTKPFPFWEWLIADIRRDHPDTVFLAEAFTRPKVMYRLAKLGFAQSYTYFTWRDDKAGLTAYFTELSTPPAVEFFGPHVFVNTPDINPYFLQTSGRPGFLIRACLATMLSGLWGMYAGFELCEGAPLPGREEYLDSEKYEIRPRDWNRPGHIRAEITLLNRIRAAHPALHQNRGLAFHTAWNDQVLLFSKMTDQGDDIVLVAVSLDPHHAQEAAIELPLDRWGLQEDARVTMDDLVTGQRSTWTGRHHRLRLDPAHLPFAIWRVLPPVRG
ncbi:alpha-1,4-glucan--maltose-1-phosphate maltosyltransferase [Tistrella mobilis]|uniref:alpha-1,4-glucan--maltose-1-phosphate maltosyltransferase n=2 Tax=Tistrella mobilis TaxID=171437 RepID=UPI003556AF5C